VRGKLQPIRSCFCSLSSSLKVTSIPRTKQKREKGERNPTANHQSRKEPTDPAPGEKGGCCGQHTVIKFINSYAANIYLSLSPLSCPSPHLFSLSSSVFVPESTSQLLPLSRTLILISYTSKIVSSPFHNYHVYRGRKHFNQGRFGH
jgi:hypothetical protein